MLLRMSLKRRNMFYFVATPIGNLQDVSDRAKQVLNSVDIILCEDTRTSLTFLNSIGVKKPLESFHKFNYKQATPKVIEKLISGKNIALISDAGTPCISDPGQELIEELTNNNIKYTIIPGACAFVNAFALSGFKTPMTFIGFLPNTNKEIKQLLEEVRNYKSTLIFYSSPHKLQEEVKTLFKFLGDRKVCYVRELTKKFEEIEFANLCDGYEKQPKGEYVIVIEGAKNVVNEFENMSVVEHFEYYEKLGYGKNDAIKQVAKDRNVAKNEIYKLIVNNQ